MVNDCVLTRHYEKDEFSYSSFFNSNYVSVNISNKSMFTRRIFIKGGIKDRLKIKKSDLNLINPNIVNQSIIRRFYNDIDNCIVDILNQKDIEENILYTTDKVVVKYNGEEIYDLNLKTYDLKVLSPGVVFKTKYYKSLEKTDIEAVFGNHREKLYNIWCSEKFLIINDIKEKEIEILDRENSGELIISVKYEPSSTLDKNYRINRLTNYKMNYDIEYEYDNLRIPVNMKSSSSRIKSTFLREDIDFENGHIKINLKQPLIIDKLFGEFFINLEPDIFISRTISILNGKIISIDDEL